MAITSIERDPFARGNVVRETVKKDERGECAWCGQPARFQYGWSDDQGPTALAHRETAVLFAVVRAKL